MNFFEHQDRARKQSRWLVLVFILAVVAIAAAVDLVILLAMGSTAPASEGYNPFSAAQLQHNAPLLLWGGLLTIVFVALASMYKIMTLRAGGGQIARQLGGILVESDPGDPRRRRLRNVVEEIALAAGVPVPDIYVLEQEPGINAFAAGYSPADAAIAVTRGTLEKLSRDELQGVIAHEFSHILNGDMRMNIRLMGALFGILLLALVGRRVLIHSNLGGRSRSKGGAAVLGIAVGLVAVGYIGQFFGRWIKAAIARQREYLADASAVQFTRDPTGIGGALKKIAVYSEGSTLVADTEEISHMLFGDGRKMLLFSTHPPLHDRIRRIQPDFNAEELERLKARLIHEETRRARELQEEAERVRAVAEKQQQGAAGGLFDAGDIVSQIGQPDWERILMAAALAASIPANIRDAARSIEWAPEVLFYSVLDRDAEIREQQLLLIAQLMGGSSEQQVRALLKSGGVPAAETRLPLLELAFPALKRRPADFVTKVLATVEKLVKLDGRIDVFEFLLARVIAQHLWSSQNPHAVQVAGKQTLADCRASVHQVLSVLAHHGHADEQAAHAAYRAGAEVLKLDGLGEMGAVQDWVAALDVELPRLDRLRSADKARLVAALIAVTGADGQTVPAELELLRAICDLIHVPLPMLTARTGLN